MSNESQQPYTEENIPPQGFPAGAPQQPYSQQPYPQDAPIGGEPSGPPPIGAQMKRRNVFAVWIGLPIITLGVYSLVWYYKIHEELKQFDSRATINPAGSLLTVMFGWVLCGIPPLVSYYNTGQRIANAQRAAGLPQTCTPVLGLVLNIFFGVGALYYQAELNKIVGHYGDVPPGNPVQLAV
jgi:Domain of unknown function (DUF4234)